MTPADVKSLVIRSFVAEHKREPTKDEVIAVMAGWLAKWIRKPDDQPRTGWPVKPEPKPLP